jgi:hypothetical protein
VVERCPAAPNRSGAAAKAQSVGQMSGRLDEVPWSRTVGMRLSGPRCSPRRLASVEATIDWRWWQAEGGTGAWEWTWWLQKSCWYKASAGVAVNSVGRLVVSSAGGIRGERAFGRAPAAIGEKRWQRDGNGSGRSITHLSIKRSWVEIYICIHTHG